MTNPRQVLAVVALLAAAGTVLGLLVPAAGPAVAAVPDSSIAPFVLPIILGGLSSLFGASKASSERKRQEQQARAQYDQQVALWRGAEAQRVEKAKLVAQMLKEKGWDSRLPDGFLDRILTPASESPFGRFVSPVSGSFWKDFGMGASDAALRAIGAFGGPGGASPAAGGGGYNPVPSSGYATGYNPSLRTPWG